jgi:aryl-alcohol dehydrogenase-like predicted oxidoreductase
MSRAAIGLGCVTFGREIDRTTSFTMLDHAATLGWTHLDTAAAYGGGASEQVVGDWLKANGARDRFTLCTKILPPYSPATIAAAVPPSLQRLQIETVDVLYLHQWHATALEPETLHALAQLVRTGRTRGIGFSNFNNDQLTEALARADAAGCAPIRALQNANNLALRAIDDTTRNLCIARGVDIVTFSPLGAGFLTGKYDTGVPEGSRFAVIPGHQRLYFTDTGRARLARLQSAAARLKLDPTDLALAWALHQRGISTVLVGGRTPAQLDRAARAQNLDLPDVFRELGAE